LVIVSGVGDEKPTLVPSRRSIMSDTIDSRQELDELVQALGSRRLHELATASGCTIDPTTEAGRSAIERFLDLSETYAMSRQDAADRTGPIKGDDLPGSARESPIEDTIDLDMIEREIAIFASAKAKTTDGR
jgi:hypothetical protein